MKLVDSKTIDELRSLAWADTHGASKHHTFLGAGMFYYGLIYSLKLRTCVCLGSGGGFVPMIMRLAQEDAFVERGRTILIDGNLPAAGWRSPNWLQENSKFRTMFDGEIVLASTRDAIRTVSFRNPIDLLFIDADHSYDRVKDDFELYLPFMATHGIVLFHDYCSHLKRPDCGVKKFVDELRGYSIAIFEKMGTGIAMLTL